ncbi:hypothetical protein ACS0TY_034725 [Phlomoides rotata]
MLQLRLAGVNMDAGMEAEKWKVTRGHRSWTKVEEDALIQCLVGIVNDGWKTDNGFKAGFQRELEKGNSGIGWNSITCTLDIIDETVWNAQRRVDHTVKALRHKSFPYYDQWVDIFGKDSANG